MAHCRPQASFTDSFEETFPSRMVFITKISRDLFVLVFVPLFSARFRGFVWVSPRISLRETWIVVSCIFVLDLVPSNAGKPLRFESFRSVFKLLVVLKGFTIPDDLGS
jgi:hypothetical protein